MNAAQAGSSDWLRLARIGSDWLRFGSDKKPLTSQVRTSSRYLPHDIRWPLSYIGSVSLASNVHPSGLSATDMTLIRDCGQGDERVHWFMEGFQGAEIVRGASSASWCDLYNPNLNLQVWSSEVNCLKCLLKEMRFCDSQDLRNKPCCRAVLHDLAA